MACRRVPGRKANRREVPKRWVTVAAACLFLFLGVGARAAEPLDGLRSFFETHCYDCHGPEKQKGDLRFDTLGSDLHDLETLEIWQNILDQLNLGEMPPAKRPQPEASETASVVQKISAALSSAYAEKRSTGGQTVLRRLNRHELRNTLRDLLHLNGVEYRPDAAASRLIDNNGNGSVERTQSDPLRFFPEDEEDGGVFNIGDQLSMSDFLLELIVGAAEETLAQATHLQPKPNVETQRFSGHLSRPGGRALEAFSHELYDDFEVLYRATPLRIEALRRGMRTAARYAVTIEVSAHRQEHPWGKLLPTHQDEPFVLALRLYKGRDNVPVKAWEIPGDGEKRSFRVETWIDEEWSPEFCWENGPTDRELRTDHLVRIYLPAKYSDPPERSDYPDKKEYDKIRAAWWRALSVALLENYQGPTLRVQGITIEPLIEHWPPRSHTLLYGSGSAQEAEIRRLISAFTERAFRRPVSAAEVEPYVQLVLARQVEDVVALPGSIKDLRYRVYEGKWTRLPDFDRLDPVERGELEGGLIDIGVAKRKDYYGLVFEGTLAVPKEAEYVFEMASDDGARILIDGQTVIEHDGLHGAQLKKGEARLAAGERTIRVEYFAYGLPNSFRAGWHGASSASSPLSVEPLRQVRKKAAATESLPPFIRAMRDAYAAVLCSPQFLYLKEATGVLDQYALASRLSYFLWSSMPDEELFELARTEKLASPAVRRQQVERMLQDPKAAAFVRHFTSAWLRLDKLGKMPPSGQGNEFAFYYNLRVEPMLLAQATTYFADLLAVNAPIEQFIDSDYTYMNQVLGKWIYRREDIRGSILRRIKLNDPRRGGIFTLPGVMAVTANGVDTSPVVRGAWLLENVLGTPPPPPPPDVEPLPTDTRDAKTIRERLALHRKHEACNSCHRKIDPMGFAFENFDVVGRWRDRYKGTKKPIQVSAVLSNGRVVKDIVEFKKMLRERKALVVRCLTEKVLSYAAGRQLEPIDRGEVDRILEELSSGGDRLRDLVHLVVNSRIFLEK